jgi:hypothetical protein
MIDEMFPSKNPRELIAQLCAERGEDFANLSRLIGRNSAYVQQFVRRGTPRRLPERERRILAQHFEVPEHLLGAEESVSGAIGFVVPSAIDAPLSEQDAPLAYRATWLADLVPGGTECIQRQLVSGDAMVPTLITGDEVLVEVGLDSTQLTDGLYVLRIEGAVQVRRLTFHPVRREVTVQSDNPAYADWPGLDPGELDLVGRVIWTGRRLT